MYRILQRATEYSMPSEKLTTYFYLHVGRNFIDYLSAPRGFVQLRGEIGRGLHYIRQALSGHPNWGSLQLHRANKASLVAALLCRDPTEI